MKARERWHLFLRRFGFWLIMASPIHAAARMAAYEVPLLPDVCIACASWPVDVQAQILASRCLSRIAHALEVIAARGGEATVDATDTGQKQ